MAGWLDILASATPRPGYGVTVKDEGATQLSSPVTIAKPIIDAGAMAVTAVLTTPSPDRQGDIVVPAGCDFAEHRVNPVVLFHHGKAGHLPIGKAEDKAGKYTVRLMKGADGSDRLVGTTHFAQNGEESGRFAASVFGLIAEDILRGVSVGFDPVIDDVDPETGVTKAIERLGPSPRLDRDALRFNKWKLLEYSHTPIGVNREALTVAVHKALDGTREMHPALLTYLTPLASPRKTVVAVGAALPKVTKAVPPDDDDDAGDGNVGTPQVTDDTAAESPDADAAATPPETPDDVAQEGAPEAGDEEGAASGPLPTPTVRALLDGAQGASDLADHLEASLDQAEHVRGIKCVKKLCDTLRKLAEKTKSEADDVVAELSGKAEAAKSGEPEEGDESDESDGSDEGDEGDEGEGDEGEESDEEKDYEEKGESLERDETGAIVVKSHPKFTPNRWTTTDLAKAKPVSNPEPARAEPEVRTVEKSADPDELEVLREENAQLAATLKNLLADVKASERVAARRR